MTSETPDDQSNDLQLQREVFALLAEVCELEPRERERALAEHTDAAVVEEVRRKLAASETFLGNPAPPPDDGLPRPIQVGDHIGPFEIRAPLGEGGMGLVFRATQHQPVRRDVALKIIRLAVLQTEARVRFEAERQAMARLDHPNVGRILEAGTTDTGMPFFAMELIDGPPITRYCDRAKLPIEQRLRLFVDVCRGTHHAHLKLLLHRDLKPSNVLVAEVDGRAVPKIIDFGIAKGLNAPLVTALAATGDRFLGTPAYMSPEALEPENELDARSDVFSLGVLLYQLLTGGLPWAAPEHDPVQLVRRRLERDAARPSTQVTSLGAAERKTTAEQRHVDAERLAQRLRGDLDSIVMKAIETDPDRRYDSAAELADDVERHLANEPIRARPLTTAVLLGKLVRRHRGPVFAAGVVVLALLVGGVGTVAGLLRARQAERTAIAEALAAEEARVEADEVAEFLTGIFRNASSAWVEVAKPLNEVTALDLLDQATDRIETDLADRPLARYRLQQALGDSFRGNGEYQRALELHRQSLSTLEALDEVPIGRLAESYLTLAKTEQALNDLDSARGHLEQALALIDTLPEESQPPIRAYAMDLAVVLHGAAGDWEATEEVIPRAIAAYEAAGKGHGPEVAVLTYNLAGVHLMTGRFAQAEAGFREALKLYEPFADARHPKLADMHIGLAGALASQGQLEEAAGLFETAERNLRERLGEDNPKRITVLSNLGRLHRSLENYELAERHAREAVALAERSLGVDHPTYARSLYELGMTLAKAGRRAEARQRHERALAIWEKSLGKENPFVAASLSQLASLDAEDGDAERALRRARRAHRIASAGLEPLDPRFGAAAESLGEILWRVGRESEAREQFEAAAKAFEAGGADTADRREALRQLLERLGVS